MQTQRNLSIDTLRLFAALEVIALHVTFQNLPSLVAIGIRLQARWAVPFFFVISGYFLARRLANPHPASVQASLQRLIWIFVLWNIIYIPAVIYQHDIKEVLRRLLLPSVLYTGDFFHLWFPSSLAFGFIIILFLQYFRLERWIPILCAGILLHILLAGAYNRVFGLKFPFDFNFARFWFSIPCLALGMWLFRRGPLKPWLAAALAAGGLGLQAFEAWFLLTRFQISAYDHEILLGTLPFALGMGSLGLSGVRALELPVLSRWGKDFSLGIYLLHALVVLLLSTLVTGSLPFLAKAAVWDIAYPFVILLTCVGILAALQRWLPRTLNFLTGDHLPRGD